VRPGDKVLGLL